MYKTKYMYNVHINRLNTCTMYTCMYKYLLLIDNPKLRKPVLRSETSNVPEVGTTDESSEKVKSHL